MRGRAAPPECDPSPRPPSTENAPPMVLVHPNREMFGLEDADPLDAARL